MYNKHISEQLEVRVGKSSAKEEADKGRKVAAKYLGDGTRTEKLALLLAKTARQLASLRSTDI